MANDESVSFIQKINPIRWMRDLAKFLQEVRQESAKITWPTRRETAITTIMVFVMAALASVFFLVADQFIRYGVTLVLGIGS
jgi:preprotein translocase subunit SecE